MSLAYGFDILPVGTQKAASKTGPQPVALSLVIYSEYADGGLCVPAHFSDSVNVRQSQASNN